MACRKADAVEVVLRPRLCFRCHTMFYICRRCDRGHRYCSPSCRTAALHEQRRQANRRHQHSLAGRQDHRDRQRAYRKRCAQRRWALASLTNNVTDKSSIVLASSSMIAAWNAGSAPLVVQSGSAAPASRFGSQPAGSNNWHPTPVLGCIVCGQRGRFVDPFPRIPRAYARL